MSISGKHQVPKSKPRPPKIAPSPSFRRRLESLRIWAGKKAAAVLQIWTVEHACKSICTWNQMLHEMLKMVCAFCTPPWLVRQGTVTSSNCLSWKISAIHAPAKFGGVFSSRASGVCVKSLTRRQQEQWRSWWWTSSRSHSHLLTEFTPWKLSRESSSRTLQLGAGPSWMINSSTWCPEHVKAQVCILMIFIDVRKMTHPSVLSPQLNLFLCNRSDGGFDSFSHAIWCLSTSRAWRRLCAWASLAKWGVAPHILCWPGQSCLLHSKPWASLRELDQDSLSRPVLSAAQWWVSTKAGHSCSIYSVGTYSVPPAGLRELDQGSSPRPVLSAAHWCRQLLNVWPSDLRFFRLRRETSALAAKQPIPQATAGWAYSYLPQSLKTQGGHHNQNGVDHHQLIEFGWRFFLFIIHGFWHLQSGC